MRVTCVVIDATQRIRGGLIYVNWPENKSLLPLVLMLILNHNWTLNLIAVLLLIKSEPESVDSHIRSLSCVSFLHSACTADVPKAVFCITVSRMHACFSLLWTASALKILVLCCCCYLRGVLLSACIITLRDSKTCYQRTAVENVSTLAHLQDVGCVYRPCHK